MNQLVQTLIEDIKPKIVAIYGGGFKPPTKGHFTVVEQTLQEYPEIDELIIYVGAGVRDGITQSQSLKIWELYSKYLPSKVKIEPVIAPVKAIMDYSKEHPEDKVYWILGAREDQEEDLKDIAKRTKSIGKYPNLDVKVITTPGGISGTKTRKALMSGDKELFYSLIPDIKEREQVWDMLSQTLSENYEPLPQDAWNLQKGIVSLTKYMVDNGMNISPLPKLKVIDNDKENADKLLGYTAHYNPGTKCITLYTLNRHPKDVLRSYAHEMVHHMQNLENRLGDVNTTNTNEDGALPDIEREAYEKGNMMLRNWEDNIKAEKYLKEYKQKALTELFEKDLPNIKKVSPTEYIVGNGDDIEAKYHFRLEIPDKNVWSIHWNFTDNNTNTSSEAWKQVTATSFKVLDDFLKNTHPKSIHISGNTEAKTKLYKNYIDKLQTILNNKYEIDNSDEDKVVLRSIEEIAQSSIKKRIETLNESYEQALNYWQNGDVNSKSKIERWNSIKKKIQREVLQELYNIKSPVNEYFLDIPKFNQPKTFVDKLRESIHEITLSKDNAVEIYGGLTNGKFQVGDIIYVYDIAQVTNPYKDNGRFYNIMFYPEGTVTSIPQQGKENYIKILSTMYKVILDFAEEAEPEYIGIASLDNDDSKNYHTIYANLTDNKFNRIPGYFRKDVSLGFDTPQGKGRFVVLKRKDI